MIIPSVVRQRRSIRKFKEEEVPETVLREILDDARWSPSWGNTQSWSLFVVSGPPLEKLREDNRGKLVAGTAPSPEIEMPLQWPEAFKQRYVGVGKRVFESLSIPREDKEARFQYTAEMFSFFGAPCMLFLCIDRALPVGYAMMDSGLILQSICLSASTRGLGTCILASSVSYPEIIRNLFPIPENKAIVIGVAIGYPDTEAPVNRFERERIGLDEFVTWVR